VEVVMLIVHQEHMLLLHHVQ